MPGPAFHLEVLRLAIEALSAGSAADQAKAQILRDNLPFASLGALGPDFLRNRPVPKTALDTIISTADLKTLTDEQKKELGEQILPNPEMAVYGAAYRLLVPRYADLQAIDDLLRKLADIVQAENVDRLKDARDELTALQPRIDALAGLATELEGIRAAGALAIVIGRPLIQAEPRALPPLSWRPFEYLRWKRTGAFGRALLELADAQNDDQLRAYAMGYLTHVAGAVAGEPFVNSIVAGPYRSHWWRNKFVRNYVDAWTFGRYETPAAMNGDEPIPPYGDWNSLCGANLQDQVSLDPIAGTDAVSAVDGGAMPATPAFDKVGNLLIAAVAKVFAGEPQLAQAPVALSDVAALRESYVGTLSVLWFMTGTQPLCPSPPGAPPPGAEVPPPWFENGTAPPAPAGGGGGGSAGAATASGIIAAILAVLALLTGSILLGVGALALGIAALINAADAGDPLDWTELRGTIYWLQVRFFQLEDSIHKALLKGGLAYPLGRELGTPPNGLFPWLPAWDESMVPLTKSRRLGEYPMRMYSGTSNGTVLPPDASYLVTPQSTLEALGTLATFEVNVYPDRIVDGTGLRNGGMLTDDGTFPARGQDFGDAVSNAADLIRAEAAGLVDYNLDGDRGYGWKTWRPKLNTTLADPTTPVSVVEE